MVSCTGCYVLGQAMPYLSQRGGAKDIGKMLNEPGLDEKTRNFLDLVLDIKSFASRIGLKVDQNYLHYKKLDKDYLAVVVSACSPFSFEPFMWDYPFLGKMPYKGFIKEDGVKAEVEALKKKGLDVFVRKVQAFSSLGFFKDPLYSFMAEYSVYDLADLLMHEQTHATIYVSNQSQFNEELATFVGKKAAESFVIFRYGKESKEYKDIALNKQDSEAFRKLILGLKAGLEKLYSGDRDEADMTMAKKRMFDEFKADLEAHYDQYFVTENYKGLASLELNNAYLSLFSTYHQDSEIYEELFNKFDKDLPAFITRVLTLKNSKDPKGEIRGWLKG